MILDFLYACQSVCLLTFLPKLYKGISPVLDFTSFWIFLRHSMDVGTLFQNNSEFHVRLSVCLFAYLLTKIRQRYISRYGWDMFLEFFEDIPTLVQWFQIILIFLYICQSGSWYTSFIICDKFRQNIGITPALDDISFWIFLDTFLGCWYTCYKKFWSSNLKFIYVGTSWIKLDTS